MSDTRLDFTRLFGAHSLKAMGGFRYLSYNYEMNNPTGQYSTAGNDKLPNVSNSMDFKDATGNDYKNTSSPGMLRQITTISAIIPLQRYSSL